MSSDEKYGVIFELLAKAKEREGLDVVRLHTEIRKQIDGGDKAFGKFLELLESLQDIVPKEKQRYRVAIKALFTTSGLTRQNVLESTDNQFEELKILEKVALSALSGFRDELDDMESRSKAIKDEMAKLREKIAEFQKEEQNLLAGMVAREALMKAMDEKVRKVFADTGSEITEIRTKIEEFTGEKVSSQPTTPSDSIETVRHDDAGEDFEIKPQIEGTSAKEVSSPPVTPPGSIESNVRDDAEENLEVEVDSEPQDTKKECPICGEVMHLHVDDARWKCYSCGREEPQEEDGAGELIKEGNEINETSLPDEKKWLKECPMCGGRMNLHGDHGIWMCYSCGHEELGTADLKNASKSAAAPETAPAFEPAPAPKPAPSVKPAAASRQKPAPVSSSRSVKQRSSRKKTCPVCRKQMNMHEEESTWKCPFCDYQRREF